MNPTRSAPSSECAMFRDSRPTSSLMNSVAFLGLGAIGAPMAAHLAPPATSLTVWNRTPKRAADFAAKTGVVAVETPADAARAADIVFTCFPVSRDVEGILDGPSGLLAGFRKNAVLVDCTSGDPPT